MRVRIGECEFDSGRRVLLRHGRVEPLSPKAFQLLEILLDRRPEAVTKQELLERLWPGTFVSEAGLYNAVAEVRAALGDGPRASRFIRTVARYGYAFHGDARPATAAESHRPGPSAARVVEGRREWPLFSGPNLLGRDHDCDVRVDSSTVSRHHARIVLESGEATLEDLQSKNGTRVNGERVEREVALRDGDRIELGSVTMTYRDLKSLSPTVTRGA